MKACYSYEEMDMLLRKYGFELIEHLDAEKMTDRYFKKYNGYYCILISCFWQPFLVWHEYLSPFHYYSITFCWLTILDISKFLLSFRLYEPTSTTLLSQNSRLSR